MIIYIIQDTGLLNITEFYRKDFTFKVSDKILLGAQINCYNYDPISKLIFFLTDAQFSIYK